MRALYILFAMIAITIAPAPAAADAVIAGWPCIEDADTINVGGRLNKGHCEGGIRVRIHGIDAPETRQICKDAQGRNWKAAKDAKKAAIAMVKGKNTLTCQHHYGQYAQGRPVVTCLIDGVDYGRELTRLGWARAYTQYSDDYINEEAIARSDAIGIWAGTCEAPWHWRRHDDRTKPEDHE